MRNQFCHIFERELRPTFGRNELSKRHNKPIIFKEVTVTHTVVWDNNSNKASKSEVPSREDTC